MYEKQKYLLDKRIKAAGLNKDIKLFFIAGGALTSVFSGRRINDLDLFFRDEADFTALRKRIERDGIVPSFATASALSYNIEGERIQLIRKYFGDPWFIISVFDFTICKAAYNPAAGLDSQFILGDDFLYDLAQKTLHYIPGDFPLSSLWRVQKFIKRDFKLPAIDAIKLALAINNLQIGNYEALKDQLEGIDTLFLKDLTDAMIEMKDEVYDFGVALEFMENVLRNKLAIGDEE
jgi:hypothetical protein